MPPEIARRVFEPFFTTKEVGEGSGLGLSMVYGFARQSGGTVLISSRVAHGTSVTLYLPSAGPAPANQPRAEAARPPRPETGEPILVVDGNPLVGQIGCTMLSSIGYSPVVVIDASSAIAAMERPYPISLLLTD